MAIAAHPLNALSHTPPLALLEAVRVAPRAILFDEGHFFGSIPMPGEHRGGQPINLESRNEPGSDISFPQLP